MSFGTTASMYSISGPENPQQTKDNMHTTETENISSKVKKKEKREAHYASNRVGSIDPKALNKTENINFVV